MDRLGLAGLRHCRYRNPASDGAALTYARRYALFALVGIAGEDDLDAPDLLPPEQPVSKHDEPRTGNSRLNGGRQRSPQRVGGHRVHAAHSRSAEQMIEPEASAVLRDRLVAELEGLSSGDDAAVWAHRSLPEKNKLTPADAQHGAILLLLRLYLGSREPLRNDPRFHMETADDPRTGYRYSRLGRVGPPLLLAGYE
jgi:hypothetical protein